MTQNTKDTLKEICSGLVIGAISFIYLFLIIYAFAGGFEK